MRPAPSSPAGTTSVPRALPTVFQAALQILLRAREYATEQGVPPWEFAIELPSLQAAGLSSADLRWLTAKGYLAHAEECSVPEKEERQFRHGNKLRLTANTCFILTAAGTQLASTHSQPVTPSPAQPGTQTEIPKYYPDLKELWFKGQLVKRFRVPACNQELILSVFEEEGWPPHIDDPLPGEDEIEPKKRLEHAIHKLNQHQLQRAIRFMGAGDGAGVRWLSVGE